MKDGSQIRINVFFPDSEEEVFWEEVDQFPGNYCDQENEPDQFFSDAEKLLTFYTESALERLCGIKGISNIREVDVELIYEPIDSNLLGRAPEPQNLNVEKIYIQLTQHFLIEILNKHWYPNYQLSKRVELVIDHEIIHCLDETIRKEQLGEFELHRPLDNFLGMWVKLRNEGVASLVTFL